MLDAYQLKKVEPSEELFVLKAQYASETNKF
jgi:hypothetical protein